MSKKHIEYAPPDEKKSCVKGFGRELTMYDEIKALLEETETRIIALRRHL